LCARQTSVIAGTIFEGTRKPLLDWFEVAWRITTVEGEVGPERHRHPPAH
jgi:hypothetical protein